MNERIGLTRDERVNIWIVSSLPITGKESSTPAGNLHKRRQDLAAFVLEKMASSRGDCKLVSRASYALMQTAQPDSPWGLD